MKYAAIISVLISFAISAILCPILIPFLRKLKFGQTIRDEGPKAHMKKSGTPTMGGLAILISVAVTSLFFRERLSQDHSGPVHHGRIRDRRTSG